MFIKKGFSLFWVTQTFSKLCVGLIINRPLSLCSLIFEKEEDLPLMIGALIDMIVQIVHSGTFRFRHSASPTEPC